MREPHPATPPNRPEPVDGGGSIEGGEGLFELPDEPVEDGRYWRIAIARDGAVEAATDDGGGRP